MTYLEDSENKHCLEAEKLIESTQWSKLWIKTQQSVEGCYESAPSEVE